MTGRAAAEAAITAAHRSQWARVVAATLRTTRDLDLAEECVQEAYASALLAWSRDGVPVNPAAWLTTTARRRAVDVIRRAETLRTKLPLLVEPAGAVEDIAMAALDDAAVEPEADLPDERLRLIFLCCHPALAPEAQVALTLRLVCGLQTPEIARAFLVPEATMAARLTRAKRKIAGSRIPFRLPHDTELPDRLRPVLGVVHLVFTTGHTAPSGDALVRADLVDQAIHLGRMLHELMPDEAEVGGLLALMLVTDARRATRTDGQGRLLRLQDQDRSRWNRRAITEADGLITRGLRSGRAGRFTLQAAIAALYAEPASYADTDWAQVVVLYDRLLTCWPNPVVALNRVVPLAMAEGPDAGLAAVQAIEDAGDLLDYHYLWAIKADLLARLARITEATTAFRRALDLSTNEAERQFLRERIAALVSVDPARP